MNSKEILPEERRINNLKAFSSQPDQGPFYAYNVSIKALTASEQQVEELKKEVDTLRKLNISKADTIASNRKEIERLGGF